MCFKTLMRAVVLLAWFVQATLAAAAPAADLPWANLQFFGDVFLSERSVALTASTDADPQIFMATRRLLASADHNIANLEGVITEAFVPLETKRFLLRMPQATASILHAVGIDAVTLANNHSFDFGFQGLLETMTALARAGIGFTGAGVNAQAAAAPLILAARDRTICLLAFSRTQPKAFWATSTRAGTAFASSDMVRRQIAGCIQAGALPIVTFHWGLENHPRPQPYQEELAHLAIDAGAILVIGHHPHMLQDMTIYKGRPIFYSLGNFAFGTQPHGQDQEGLALRLRLAPAPSSGAFALDVVPLRVQNGDVHFRPRLLDAAEDDPFRSHLPRVHPCSEHRNPRRWTCAF